MDSGSKRTVTGPRSSTSGGTVAEWFRCTGNGSQGFCPGSSAEEGLCMEADKWEKKDKWKHVGKGKGAYELVSRYEDVGAGKGNFKELTEEPKPKCSRCCLCWLFLLILALLLGLYWSLAKWVFKDWPHPETALPEALRSIGVMPSKPYECESKHMNWMDEWSAEHKDWCCSHEQMACPANHDFDCKVDLSSWNHSWTLGKKQFCCGWTLEGCTEKKTTTTPDPEVFECEEGLQDWQRVWSTAKKEFCCDRYRWGCEGSTTVVPYDCEADIQKWKSAWSAMKKEWCCEHERVGCEHGQELALTGCDTPCEVKGKSFSCKERVRWLAKTDLKGKAEACELGLATVMKECPVCSACSVVDTGCSDKDFKCNEGRPEEWTEDKQQFCCDKEQLGCHAANSPYKCVGAPQEWSEKEKVWCCDNREIGCNL